MSCAQVHTQANAIWNPQGKVPLSEWLRQTASDVDIERLKAVGNVAMPACSRLGLHLLGTQLNNLTSH